VGDEEVEKIRKMIQDTFKEKVELAKKIDEEIIGGFVLTIEDMQYDASVARNLRKMKNQLMKTSLEK
jgi:F-type H+-transporting ATPase subunit delta